MEFSFGKSDIAAFERLLRAYDEAMSRDAELNNSTGVSLSEAELRKLGAKKLDPRVYEKDPYYQALSGLAKRKAKGATLGKTTIKARSPFLANEERSKEGDAASIVQPYGYLDRDFAYPSISENRRIWMSLCPHEIETMREAAQKLTGRVLVLGLGLGYVPYLLSLKTDVSEIVVVDSDPGIIHLFKEELLPRFSYSEKVKIVKEDAFEYLDKKHPRFNGVFADLWHDQEDGFPLYYLLRKRLDAFNVPVFYWIEKTIILYVRMGLLILADEEFRADDKEDEKYMEAETQSDAIVNALHFVLKGRKVDSYKAFEEIISDDSIRKIIPELDIDIE